MLDNKIELSSLRCDLHNTCRTTLINVTPEKNRDYKHRKKLILSAIGINDSMYSQWTNILETF